LYFSYYEESLEFAVAQFISRVGAAFLLLAMQGLAADTVSHFAPYSGGRVHYESYGSGNEAVVFIHGWTCDLTFWREQAPLYQSRRALLIDLPGHGESDKPHVPYPMEFFARGIEAVMRHAGVDRAVLVGHSLGGPISYAFLRLFPEKVKALVLVDAEVTVPQATTAYREAQKARYARNVQALSGPTGRKYMATQIEGMFSVKTPPEWREQIRTKMLATPDHVRVAAVSSPSQLEPPKPGETFALPVLAIQAAPMQDFQIVAIRKLFPNIRIEKWEGHGHFLMVEDPQRFNQTLQSFLDF
jgi:pimeloyl-ACP methyl ester carboxylesterase